MFTKKDKFKPAEEDVVQPKRVWNPPYHIVLGRFVKWAESVDLQIMAFFDDPVYAYVTYCRFLDEVSKSKKKNMHSYVLQDSFGKDALEFCRDLYEQELEGLGSV